MLAETPNSQRITPFWRLPKVIEFTALSRSTILRKIDAKQFPRPVRLGTGSAVAWPSHEVMAWAAARIAERDEAAA